MRIHFYSTNPDPVSNSKKFFSCHGIAMGAIYTGIAARALATTRAA